MAGLGRRLTIWLARLVRRPARRLGNWAGDVCDAEDVRVATEVFPPGTRVRLVANGCCQATLEAGNREGEWIVQRYVDDAGVYSLMRPPPYPYGVAFVHANGMVRA